jgi:hypothetical protein
MIDIETLSKQPNATVLSIGAVYFDCYSISDTFYDVLSIDEQNERHVEGDTVKWWLKQSDGARLHVAVDASRGLWESLGSLSRFIRADAVVWAKDPDFDCVILESLFYDFGLDAPWGYRNKRAVRTLQALVPGFKEPEFVGTEHNAIQDAIHQAKNVQLMMKELNNGDYFNR